MRILTFIVHQLSRFRLLLYKYKILKTHSFNIPVISVGNIEYGGTGKTPMVAWLIKKLQSENKKPCVITRGYGRSSNKTIIVDHKKKYTVDEIGDEPFTLIRENPKISMVVSKNKVEAINTAISRLGVDVVVLDDGFQSVYIKRDLDIVMMNVNKFSSINRESIGSLSRCDMIIFKPDWPHIAKKDGDKIQEILEYAWSSVKRNNVIKNIKNISKNNIPCIQAYASISIEDENNAVHQHISQPIIAVSGIADPTSFKYALARNNVVVKDFLIYNDHHVYSEGDMQNIYNKMKHNKSNAIITTTKDYYKIKSLDTKNIKIYLLKMKFDFINIKKDRVDGLNTELLTDSFNVQNIQNLLWALSQSL